MADVILALSSGMVKVGPEWWPVAGVLLDKLGIGWTSERNDKTGAVTVRRIDGKEIPKLVVDQTKLGVTSG